MSTPTSNSISAYELALTGDPIDAMLVGGRWGSAGGVNLTYSFANSTSTWISPTYSPDNEPFTTGVEALSIAERANVRLALDQWARSGNIRFTEVSDTPSIVGDIRISYTMRDTDEQAYAYGPGSLPAAGDIWFNSDVDQDGFFPGTYGFMAAMHEVGHSLGLKHPFEAVPGNGAILDEDLDSLNYTIMSYELYPGYLASHYGLSYYPTTPMALDIAAIQAVYGANLTFNASNTTYSFHQGADYFQTIVDSGGTDTIVWTGTTEGTSIDLESGSWSNLGNSLLMIDSTGSVIREDEFTVFLYFDTVIENATGGAADDLLSGNDIANLLNGNAGHDYLYGFDGADTLLGGEGNDHIYGRYHTPGADGADSLSGGAGSDLLQGNAGNDTLDGGEGSDRILGGANDDMIRGGAGTGGDTINGNLGNDTIDGGDGNDSLRGGQGNDVIAGGNGDDLLSGDLGVDVLTGGAGADLFMVSAGGSLSAAPDRITDFADGTDHIAIGFAPVLLSGSSSSAAAALSTAQQMIDSAIGNGEVVAMRVGSDSYLFYSASAGATIDSAMVLTGIDTDIIGASDFA